MQAQVVANELAGERQSRTVSYAITGDAETDIISGVLALVGSQPKPYATVAFDRMVSRVMQYLAQRFEQSSAEREKLEHFYAKQQQPVYPAQSYPGTNQAAQPGIGNYQTLAQSLGLSGIQNAPNVCGIDPTKDY